jgi:hypothetical protein
MRLLGCSSSLLSSFLRLNVTTCNFHEIAGGAFQLTT